MLHYYIFPSVGKTGALTRLHFLIVEILSSASIKGIDIFTQNKILSSFKPIFCIKRGICQCSNLGFKIANSYVSVKVGKPEDKFIFITIKKLKKMKKIIIAACMIFAITTAYPQSQTANNTNNNGQNDCQCIGIGIPLPGSGQDPTSNINQINNAKGDKEINIAPSSSAPSSLLYVYMEIYLKELRMSMANKGVK
jgi:hypothetical protein